MIQTISSFINYFDGIRNRTLNYINTIPADKIDWSPRQGELTCGDIIRHLAAGEKMFCGVVADGRWQYAGHDKNLAASRAELIAYLEATHTAAMNQLRAVDDSQLNQPRPALKGGSVKAWRWLMAMVEHEVHHRSQLASYLSLMGITPPHIYGLGIEDIVALTTT
ncbi:MAG: DinB family protein [Chloroflexi bacterium]|nr:DinB family protein [Chloroflexota bacterium]